MNNKTTPAKPETKATPKTVTVILTTGMAGVRESYSPKDPYTCSEAEADRLIAAGFARAD